jgi:hypothetical protein
MMASSRALFLMERPASSTVTVTYSRELSTRESAAVKLAK